MVVKHLIEGYGKLDEFIKSRNKDEKVVLLFTGAATDTAASWCPDCIAGDKLVMSYVNKITKYLQPTRLLTQH